MNINKLRAWAYRNNNNNPSCDATISYKATTVSPLLTWDPELGFSATCFFDPTRYLSFLSSCFISCSRHSELQKALSPLYMKMSRAGTKRRLQRKQTRKKSGVVSSEWFLGETMAQTLFWFPPGPFTGLFGSSSKVVFRSKVISDMLVVLFIIGGRGLFPNNIFFF